MEWSHFSWKIGVLPPKGGSCAESFSTECQDDQKKEVAKAMMCNTALSRAALCFSWLISQLRSSSGSIHWIWAKYRGTERSGTGKRQFHSNIPGLFSPLISEGAALRKPDAFFGKSQLGANLSRADFKFFLLSPPAAWGMKVPEGTLTQIKVAFCFPASF